MRRILQRLILVLIMQLAVTTTYATVRSTPLRASLSGAPRAARPGEPYADVLKIEVGRDGYLNDLRLAGVGWQVEVKAAPVGMVSKGEVIELPFVATTADPTSPLHLACEFDGEPWQRAIEVSAAAVAKAGVGLADVEFLPAGQTPTWGLDDAEGRMLLPGSGRVDELVDSEGKSTFVSPAYNATQSLTIKGQIGYTHLPTAAFSGAMETTVAVWSNSDDGPFTNSVIRFHGLGTTDWEGNFSFTFDWPLPEAHSRVWVQFTAENAAVEMEHTDIWEDTWSWQGPIITDPGAGTVVLGHITPRKESHQGALHIASSIMRGRKFHEEHGYYTNKVEVQWAEGGDTSWYERDWNEIHITRTDSFDDGVILHEYGHYWMDIFTTMPSFDYCNGMCDSGGCGHCLFCAEDEAIAWNEGFANFISQAGTDYIADHFSVPVDPGGYLFQNIQQYGQCPSPQVALDTEGYFAAGLYDLHDDTDFGEDDLRYPGWTDRLGGLTAEILAVANTPVVEGPLVVYPYSSSIYLEAFHAAYPAIKEDLWETLMNNGIDMDSVGPPPATGVTALDHVVGVPSPDNTINVTWDAHEDDFSGIGGYSYIFNYGTPGIADTIEDVGVTRSVISPALAVGDWYFSLRARDRSGNWSLAQNTIGPFTIRAAEPADMTYEHPNGWEYPLVPRNTDGATVSSAEVTGNLPGDQATTYWNVAGRNVGEAIMPAQPTVGLTVDGVEVASEPFARLSGGNWSFRANLGPVSIPGGRHTLGMFHDNTEVAAEVDETNNHWARQWVWQPPYMATDQVYWRPAPPERNGGFEHIASGSISYYNCDGFRSSYSLGVQAVWLFGEGSQTDYDLRLYDQFALPDVGFQTPLKLSSRNYGSLDAILVHGVNDGLNTHNFGVSNWSSSDGAYHVGKVEGTFISPPSSEVITWATNEMMAVRTINIPSGTSEDISLIVRTAPGSQPVYLAFFRADFVTANLLEAAAEDVAWDGATAQVDVNTPSGPFAAVAVYRDPKNGTGPLSFTLECIESRPDLAATTPTNWHGNIVPQSDNSIPYPFTVVPEPTVLVGDTTSTYLYMSEANLSVVDAPAQTYEIRLDGAMFSWFARPAMTPGQERKFRGASPYSVPGGRHTLGISLDAAGEVAESSETNNLYGEQWMWTGDYLQLGTPYTRAAPALRTAGFEDITRGLVAYNCLGAHSPTFSTHTGNWAGFYLVAEPTADVDLRLHDRYTDMQDGFAVVRESSTWVGAECDFVIANFQAQPHQAFDASVVKFGGSGQVTLECVGTSIMGAPARLGYGPFQLGAGLGLRLHEVSLNAGWQRFELRPAGATQGDLGLSLYGPSAKFYAKEGALPDAMAWQAGPGEEEGFLVNVPADGTYCLAVWKVGQGDLELSLDYYLGILQPTGVEDDLPLPRQTRLVSAVPNPFNPTTSIRFELAKAADTVLEIYSTRGERLRELVNGEMAAGRHEVFWDGRDHRGGGVASGIYYARLRSGNTISRIKLTLLK